MVEHNKGNFKRSVQWAKKKTEGHIGVPLQETGISTLTYGQYKISPGPDPKPIIRTY